MTDIFIPPWLNIARAGFSPVESIGGSQSPFGGFPRTATLAGGRMRATMEFTAVGGASTQSERGTLTSMLAQAGRQNRVVFGDPAFRIRGSFPAPELLPNPTFVNGTSSWTSFSHQFTVADRVAQLTRLVSNSAVTSTDLISSAQITGLTQNAPYAARAFDYVGRGDWNAGAQIGSAAGTNDYAIGTAVSGGLKTAVGVIGATTAFFGLVDIHMGSSLRGDYLEVPYTSFARCALVDGGVNLLLRSDEFNDASWTKVRSTVSANIVAAPDGTTTADVIIEDTTAANSHFVLQAATVSASALDYCFAIAIAANNRTFANLQLLEQGGNTTAEVSVNLVAGTLGVATASGNWSNPRAIITPLGNGYFYVALMARKLNSATIIQARVYSANALDAYSFNGSGTGAIKVWRGTLGISAVPIRLKQTTSAALPSGESQRGNSLHLKGLPPSTTGLLLRGDLVEVIGARGGELKVVTAALNSDPAGLGYLQFAPAMRFSPPDNAGVIIQQPMGRFISLSEAESWTTDPGIITTASTEFIEA